jgi:hypothetical protein
MHQSARLDQPVAGAVERGNAGVAQNFDGHSSSHARLGLVKSLVICNMYAHNISVNR